MTLTLTFRVHPKSKVIRALNHIDIGILILTYSNHVSIAFSHSLVVIGT